MAVNNKVKNMGKKDTNSDINNLSVDDVFNLADLYFKQKNIMFSHQYNSFNKFIDEDVKNLLKYGDNIFFEKITETHAIKYKFKYNDISIIPPMLDNEDEVMYPSDARDRNLTYSIKLVATVTQIQEKIDINTGTKITKVIGYPAKNVPIAIIPTMVKSKYCTLNIKKGHKNKECDMDPGGYFIVNGAEKFIVSLERMCDNKPLVFTKKDSNMLTHLVQVNSRSHKPNGITQIITIRMKKDNTMYITVPILKEIPVFVLFKALGVVSDRDIINHIVYDSKDMDMINVVRMSLDDTINELTGEKIITQDDAINYLTSKMRILKKYTDTDKDVKQQQKIMHLKNLLDNNLLPHIEQTGVYKAFYFGYMINRMLRCFLGRIPKDDRDSYVNKRIDLPGNLIEELFRQHYKKMLNECNRIFKKRNNDDENPFNIINQIKPNVIEQGLKTALSIGAWSGKRQGVAQMLQRLSYLYTISSLRRVNSPSIDSSTSKLTKPRHLHPTQLGYICSVETPGGIKVGLVKNLSMIGNITIMRNSQIVILKSLLLDKVDDLRKVPITDISMYTKVFLNGELLGITDKAYDIYIELKKKKINGDIEMTTSIVYDIEQDELKVYCDGGRLFRPLLRVKENEILLKKSHLDMITTENTHNPIMIKRWNEFLIKNKGLIEYIDMEEQMHCMLASSVSRVKKMRERMVKSIDIVKKMTKAELENVINRYDETTYIKYTHCEIHPSLLVGVVTVNIPFCNHNVGPRNMYQYSQARHSMGIFATNYRYRMDISYILYYPQSPLIVTRTSKYVNTDKMSLGENAIVAIATYTGYNQEDSLIVNKSAIDRGRYRCMSLKKKFTIIKKNQSTSQDDQFMKPDPTQVTGMRHNSYDKLNNKGYVPEETVINGGDIVLAKVSPIQPIGDSTKVFKDNSEVYHSHIPGVVDKVLTGIYNYEGYEMMKMRIRSERIPRIGDKFCSRNAQKGTTGIVLAHKDMPFTSRGITPDIIVNPNALPSRKTTAQLIECFTGKLAAVKGYRIDATPFEKVDLNELRKELAAMGYKDDGTEEMYNGMTGKKFEVRIFVGPTYYMRLKHMVLDKIHSRARGPRTLLTRQAPEGRSRDGGLRFGEMERDCMIAHGMALFLKERMLETADAYSTYVCDDCGLFAQRMRRKDQKSYATSNDIYFCPSCRNKTRISKIMIPYAFKLLVQELMSMSIAPRIKVKKNKYNEVNV